MRAYEDWVIEAETRGLKISKRNATGATIALAAAEMALSGVKSAISIDEVIDTMGKIGKQMPCALKETAQGGLAVTPTGRRIQADFL